MWFLDYVLLFKLLFVYILLLGNYIRELLSFAKTSILFMVLNFEVIFIVFSINSLQMCVLWRLIFPPCWFYAFIFSMLRFASDFSLFVIWY